MHINEQCGTKIIVSGISHALDDDVGQSEHQNYSIALGSCKF